VGTVQSAASEMGLEHRGARSLEWTCHAVSTSRKKKVKRQVVMLRRGRCGRLGCVVSGSTHGGAVKKVDVLRDYLLIVWAVWPEQLRASAVLLQVQRLGTRHSHTGQQP
jgi:hypothetical protein